MIIFLWLWSRMYVPIDSVTFLPNLWYKLCPACRITLNKLLRSKKLMSPSPLPVLAGSILHKFVVIKKFMTWMGFKKFWLGSRIKVDGQYYGNGSIFSWYYFIGETVLDFLRNFRKCLLWLIRANGCLGGFRGENEKFFKLLTFFLFLLIRPKNWANNAIFSHFGRENFSLSPSGSATVYYVIKAETYPISKKKFLRKIWKKGQYLCSWVLLFCDWGEGVTNSVLRIRRMRLKSHSTKQSKKFVFIHVGLLDDIGWNFSNSSDLSVVYSESSRTRIREFLSIKL